MKAPFHHHRSPTSVFTIMIIQSRKRQLPIIQTKQVHINPEIFVKTHTHTINVWYIDLNLVDFYGIINVGKYAIYGSCGTWNFQHFRNHHETPEVSEPQKTSGVPLAWLWVPRRVSLCSHQGWTCLGEEEMEENKLRGGVFFVGAMQKWNRFIIFPLTDSEFTPEKDG